MDDMQAADDMTTKLINIGHRRIGFIKGHPNHMASTDRQAGYQRALGRVGISVDPALIAEGLFDFESGVAATDQFLSLKYPPTAIFASNDDMASGVLAVAHRRGIQIPEQLSVAGFDDTTLARVIWPPLTTVRQPVRELASTAADLLFGEGGIEHRRLPHELISRESVAPPYFPSLKKSKNT
jgi:LacI family transcriptional regulator